jgi:hypothetical protein
LDWLQNKFTNCKDIRKNTNSIQTTGIKVELDTWQTARNRWLYCRTDRMNNGRPLKRLLDTWGPNGSTSGLKLRLTWRWWWLLMSSLWLHKRTQLFR